LNRARKSETDPLSRLNRGQIRCAIYTRKSTDEGLDHEFNSLDAQRDAAEAFILSQRGEGLVVSAERYDDGGYSGSNLERPALERLLADIRSGTVECVVVYKVDRLSRSLIDFARIIEIFEKHTVSFVSVTQQFNTTNSLGRLTLNILLSFAQFEREIIAERTRDKMSAARRKGKWIGGRPVLGSKATSRARGSSRVIASSVIVDDIAKERHAAGQAPLGKVVPRSDREAVKASPYPGPLRGTFSDYAINSTSVAICLITGVYISMIPLTARMETMSA
jgi:DNA invertase Pin-like site-specific DNA recombinase